ncbi:MAG: helix-turn-helix transcriptional regulator [Clostridia bacterium]|nr:helix-turn-helix transcriptional regulator [Clostridia bacterium]
MSDFHQLQNSMGDSVFNTYEYTKYTYPAHFHKSYELLYVGQGSALCTVDEKTVLLNKGDFFLIFPYRIHSFQVNESSTLFVSVFSGSFIKSFVKMTAGKEGSISPFRCSATAEELFREKIQHKFNAFFGTLSDTEILTVKACLYMICCEYLEKVELSAVNAQGNETVMQILDQISRRFTENITLQSISEELGYSYQYVSKIFSQRIRTNFKALVNQYRYEYAKQLLTETDKSISEIAFESGFQSIRSFNFVFSSFANQTPREFRARNIV